MSYNISFDNDTISEKKSSDLSIFTALAASLPQVPLERASGSKKFATNVFISV